jgi:hypothetical protein
LNEFAKAGYIFPWHEEEKFEQVYEKSKDFVPKEFISDNKKITEFLIKYIDAI